MIGLRVADAHIDEGFIKAIGKGDVERTVPIGLTSQKELIAYIEFHRPSPAHPDTENVFLTHDGRPISRSGLCSVMERLKRRSGVPRLHAHLFRHTALTRMIEAEVPAYAVQQFAGHASIKTTEIYVHLAQLRTSRRYQKNSVVDRMGIDRKRKRRRR